MGSYCEDLNVLNIMRVINNIISLLKYIIPLILIVLIMIKFLKAIMDGTEDGISNAIKSSVSKFIAAVLIFLVPTIIYGVFNVINVDNSIINCFKNGNKEKIAELTITTSRQIIDRLYSSLSEDDYYLALKYVNNINDSNLKDQYMKELDSLKVKIDYNKLVTIVNTAMKNLYLSDNDLKYVEQNISLYNNQSLINRFKLVKEYSSITKDINSLYTNYNSDKYQEIENKINNISDEQVKNTLLGRLEAAKRTKYNSNIIFDYKGVDTPAGGRRLDSCNKENVKSFDVSNLECPLYYGSEKIKRDSITFNTEIGDELIEILIQVCSFVKSNDYIEYLQDDGFFVSKNGYHGMGLAFDLNDLWSYNGHHPYGSMGNITWERYQKFICEECDGKENCDKNVNYHIFHNYFEGKGWCWGGNWGPSSFDPMHFEYRAACEDNCLTKKREQVKCD